jgi:diadenylate cyclase
MIAGTALPQFSWPGIGLTDILDILLVAFALYFFLRWIRRTRTWPLFRGIVIILAVSAFAYLLDLITVKWIVQNAFAMGLIVVVVLFQPELRKALEQIGRGKLFNFLTVRSAHERNIRTTLHTVNEVVKAARDMAAVRTGALIVLEQAVSLSDLERTGIPVDAQVSSQLLLNIFEKNTPLHDGAVLIRNNRVSAATCILPLTTAEISHDLGTRHRAALGASETSDALVAVVSEETGGISVAKNGQLARDLNEQQLRDILMTGEMHTRSTETTRAALFKHRREKS